MKLSWNRQTLKLEHTFTISRSSRDEAQVVIVKLEHDGTVGYGEASPSSRARAVPAGCCVMTSLPRLSVRSGISAALA